MTATATSSEVTRYLDEVRALLADLPDDERDELLDDLAVHLQEVAAETGVPLEQAVGTPAAFAAELRASAGLGGQERAARNGWVAARERLAQVRHRVESSGPLRWVRALLPELVPGWWVLRGYLAVVILSVMGGEHHFPYLPVPTLFGSAVLGLAAVVGAVVASVKLGRRHRHGARPRWATAVDVLVVFGALFAVGTMRDHIGPQYVFSEAAPTASGAFSHPDGTPITNLFPYDEDGRLLDGVLLYDQDGRPVVIGDDGGYSDPEPALETDHVLDANGAEVTNLYPLDQRIQEWRYEDDGGSTLVAEPVRPPAIAPPRLADPEPTTTSTTSPPTTTAPLPTTVPPTTTVP